MINSTTHIRTNMAGRVVKKEVRHKLFKKRYYIHVKFNVPYNKKGLTVAEFEVDSIHYNNMIIGSFARGKFDQVPEGLQPMYIY